MSSYLIMLFSLFIISTISPIWFYQYFYVVKTSSVFVCQCIGVKQAHLLKFEKINIAQTYLSCSNVLDILKLESPALIHLKFFLIKNFNEVWYIIERS